MSGKASPPLDRQARRVLLRRVGKSDPIRFALPGAYRVEASLIHAFCLERGMSWQRAYIMACASSYGRICWTFQSKLASFTGYSVRTIQRAMRQAKKLGVIRSRRLRRGERPPGATQPITCGGALRKFVAWGLPVVRAAVVCLSVAVQWQYREAAVEARAERERAEAREAVAEFRNLAPP